MITLHDLFVSADIANLEDEVMELRAKLQVMTNERDSALAKVIKLREEIGELGLVLEQQDRDLERLVNERDSLRKSLVSLCNASERLVDSVNRAIRGGGGRKQTERAPEVPNGAIDSGP